MGLAGKSIRSVTVPVSSMIITNHKSLSLVAYALVATSMLRTMTVELPFRCIKQHTSPKTTTLN